MSSTDKTRQKLMASMRKTKAGSGSSASQAATGKKTATKSAPKTARKAAATPGKAGAGKTARDKAKPRPVVADPYQGGRRVWPD